MFFLQARGNGPPTPQTAAACIEISLRPRRRGELWDLRNQERADFLPSNRSVDGASKDARFLPGNKVVLVSNGDGLQIVPLQKRASGNAVLQSDAVRRLSRTASTWARVDRNGRFAALRHVTSGSSGLIIDLQEPEKITA